MYFGTNGVDLRLLGVVKATEVSGCMTYSAGGARVTHPSAPTDYECCVAHRHQAQDCESKHITTL